MKAIYKQLVDKSIAAALAAIEVYNKPDFRYREESFVILLVNAWELLLKAKILKDSKNRLSSLYVPGAKTSAISTIMKAHKLKANEGLSAYSFRTKAQEQAYVKTKRLPKGITSIYNEDAVQFIVQRLQEMPAPKNELAQSAER